MAADTQTVYTNHLGMRFAEIPGGSFFMGACRPETSRNEGEDCPAATTSIDAEAYEDETPQHQVSVPTFQLGRTQVSLRQFRRYIEASGNSQLLTPAFLEANAGQGETTPVVHVNWQDAQAFISWLNQSKPATDTGHYRLPTEAEWEYAARAGSTAPYPFGELAETDRTDKIEQTDNPLALHAWYDKNAGNRQRAVGTRKANAFGLYDMLGNVWEWTADCWNESYHGAPADGSAWLSGDCEKRVVRGGSWYDVQPYLRMSTRFGDRATRRINYDGFRVVRDVR